MKQGDWCPFCFNVLRQNNGFWLGDLRLQGKCTLLHSSSSFTSVLTSEFYRRDARSARCRHGCRADLPTACAKIEIFQTNRCPELQTYSKKTGPTRHALQAPSQHRRSSFWTLTQPIREPTSLKLAQTDTKWPPSDRAIWRAKGRERPEQHANQHAKRQQSAHSVCACVCRHQLPPDHDP